VRAVLVRPGPNFSVEDVADGWHRALTDLGVDVRSFDLGGAMTFYEQALRGGGLEPTGQDAARMAAKDLRSLCYDWWPDIVLVVSSFYLPPECYEIMRGRGHKIVTLFTESPYEDDNQILIAPYTDVCLINDPQNLDRFLEANPNSRYVPHAYDPARHHPQPAQDRYRSDFCFVGTGYPSRVEFFESCDFTGIDVALAGNWQDLNVDSPLHKFMAHPESGVCCPNDETALLYASTKSGMNTYRTESQRPELAEGWAMGPREVELAACGTFYLTEPRGENRAVLPMVPTFDGPADFSEKLRWWLAHDVLREQVAEDARNAIADRTFTNHARDLLATL
jgi:spore maturation protein CgeB